MSKVKIGFSGLNVPEQIERTRLITGKMDGNALYVTPVPALVDVNKAADDLEDAYNASRGRDKVKTAEMRLRRKELLFLIGQLSVYVQQASGADGEKILSSGFDVAKTKTPKPVVAGEVHNLRVDDGTTSGRIKAEWDKATDAVMYMVEVSKLADFSTIDKRGFTTKTQKEHGGFAPGTKYWVRITALGREEAGTVSEPVSIIAR